MKSATTPEQSRRILACGVFPDSADMSHIGAVHDCSVPYIRALNTFGRSKDTPAMPAWSLTSLLAILPPNLYDRQGHTFNLAIEKDRLLHIGYKASYRPSFESQGLGDLAVAYAANPIEACVQLAERITAKGYKLRRPQKD